MNTICIRPSGASFTAFYDVSSNSFSLNQADLIIERAADLQAGQRIGMRLDLQYGQATQTLQGNPTNELRPQVYRNIFQAYGTYVFPLAAGLTVDFGKWASSLGDRGELCEGSAQLFPLLLVRFPALLSHGTAGEACDQ